MRKWCNQWLKIKERKKACKTALYGKIKEERETKAEWLIRVQTQNVFYLSIVITQIKTKQSPVRRLLMRVMECKARINDW